MNPQHSSNVATLPLKKRAGWVNIVIYAVLGFWSVVCLFPLYWVVVTSFKGEPEIIEGPFYLPFVDFTPNLKSWVATLTYSNDHLVSRFYNSTIVAICSTLLTVSFGGMAVYGLTRFRYDVRWKRLVLFFLAAIFAGIAFVVPTVWVQFLFALVTALLLFSAVMLRQTGLTIGNEVILFALLATRILPPIVVVLPLYMMGFYTHTLDTHVPLIFSYTASNLPVAIWLLLPVFGKFATSQEEAAQLDGASRISIFFTIFLPMVAASTAAVGLLIFVLCWNEYLFAAYLASDSVSTMPPWVIGQMSIKEAQVGGDSQEWPQLSAAMIFMVVPVLACAGFAQRYLSGVVSKGQ